MAVTSIIDISRISDQDTINLIEILKVSGNLLKQTTNNYVDALSENYIAHAKIEELDFQQSLDNVLKSIGFLVQTSEASVHANFSKLPKLRFNKAYLESVLLNLITNSIKYAMPGVAAVISIQSDRVDGTSQLTVVDNGVGFDMKKVKNNIFGLHKKFHNHKESKSIGLYLVYNQVTSLGGEISVESKINKGAKFTISFRD